MHRIDVRAPFDWDGLIAWLGARAIPGVERVEDRSYARGTVRVCFDGQAVRSTGARSLVSRVFDVDAEPAAIHAVLQRDPMLEPLLRQRPGVRVPGAWDPFELALRAVVGQQVSVAAARTILGRIAATHGLAAEALAGVDLQGMPRRRAATVRTLASAVASGEVVLGRDDLTKVPGIGPWTASYVAMRLGDRDAFPAGDLVLRRKAGNLTERELARRAETWRPFRAYGAMLLWQA